MYHVKGYDIHRGNITDVALEQILNQHLADGLELVAMAIGAEQLILTFRESSTDD